MSWPVVGDDPAPEVPMARRGGALAVAVGTRIGTASAFAGLLAGRRPDLLVTGAGELLELCSAPGQHETGGVHDGPVPAHRR